MKQKGKSYKKLILLFGIILICSNIIISRYSYSSQIDLQQLSFIAYANEEGGAEIDPDVKPFTLTGWFKAILKKDK